jgi:hypothetical protein
MNNVNQAALSAALTRQVNAVYGCLLWRCCCERCPEGFTVVHTVEAIAACSKTNTVTAVERVVFWL